VIGSLGVPVIVFIIFGRSMRGRPGGPSTVAQLPFNITILAAILIALSAVQSLIAIMAIYREGGILKRLRATPLSPLTILGAHVLVKLAFTLASLVLLILAGRRVLPGAVPLNIVSFTAAAMLGTLSILSLGFVLASVVPTARFAQPLGAAIFYPMLALSGLFIPLERLPRVLQWLATLLPTTHAVSLMQGVWDGAGWGAEWISVVALLAIFALCIALSTRWFRWE
jgi:ABC-2 type transport system permease protein